MKKIFLPLIVALAALTSCNNCLEGVGDSVEENRILADFDELVLDCSADVIIRQNLISEKNRVNVIAQENLMPMIKTNVKGGSLIIDIEGCVTATAKLEIEVFTNGLSRITADGSGDVSTKNALKGESLTISSDGSGDMEIKFRGEEMEVSSDGSGDLRLSGEAEDLSIDTDGSGDVDAFEFNANDVEVTADGSGNVNITAKKSLEVTLSGSGNVSYKGNPQEIQQSNHGSGNIKNVD
ncbi:MAG: hypothetical protein HKN32_01100 [Flavobacteriales bacterium]|nr:hypothetical protein [Flavobacteriales bacterium]